MRHKLGAMRRDQAESGGLNAMLDVTAPNVTLVNASAVVIGLPPLPKYDIHAPELAPPLGLTKVRNELDVPAPGHRLQAQQGGHGAAVNIGWHPGPEHPHGLMGGGRHGEDPALP